MFVTKLNKYRRVYIIRCFTQFRCASSPDKLINLGGCGGCWHFRFPASLRSPSVVSNVHLRKYEPLKFGPWSIVIERESSNYAWPGIWNRFLFIYDYFKTKRNSNSKPWPLSLPQKRWLYIPLDRMKACIFRNFFFFFCDAGAFFPWGEVERIFRVLSIYVCELYREEKKLKKLACVMGEVLLSLPRSNSPPGVFKAVVVDTDYIVHVLEVLGVFLGTYKPVKKKKHITSYASIHITTRWNVLDCYLGVCICKMTRKNDND